MKELDKLEELININFPKNECKERGYALVVFAEFSIWLKEFKNVK